MRMNRKKKKLKFIREKNGARKGYAFFEVVKISRLLTEEEVQSELEWWAEHIAFRLQKRFRLKYPFDYVSHETAMEGLDFVRNMFTLRFKFRYPV